MTIPNIILLPPNRVWRTYLGGKVLDAIQNKAEAEDTHFPEDWIASTTRALNKGREEFHSEGLSEVEVNESIETLKSLMEKFPMEMVGKGHFDKYGANTQFLIKFLDSSIRLHIQAHPTIPFAQKYLNSNSGKTEAYVILSTREEVKDPYIYLGFQNPVKEEQLREIILKQDIEKLLSCFEKIPVKPGDVFIVPGGLPHAIGEGVFMIEIMEPTDYVVRVEFERGGYVLPEAARFMGRDVDFALSMMDLNRHTVEELTNKYFCKPELLNESEGGKEYVLIDKRKTPCFSVHKLDISDRFTKQADSFYVGVVTKGNGTISSCSSQYNIKKGDKFFIPFKAQKVEFLSDENMEIILAFPPEYR